MAEVVDGLTWTRSKPDLRMYREMFGMSTAEFGRLAAVDGRTVRAWENPREWVPDRTAWLAAVLLHDMGLEPSVVYAEADPEAMF